MVHVSLHRAMLTSTGAVHVSVKIDHRLRVGTVHVSERPEIAKKTLISFPRKSPFPVGHVKAHLKLSSGLCCFSSEYVHYT